jgi:hypothetical protein
MEHLVVEIYGEPYNILTCVKPSFLCLQMRREPHGIMAGKILWGFGHLLQINEREPYGFEGKTMSRMAKIVEANTIKTCSLVTVAHGQFEPSVLR